jgi:hypothetical protein
MKTAGRIPRPLDAGKRRGRSRQPSPLPRTRCRSRAFDTENQAGDDNKVSGSESNQIGAPVTVWMCVFSAKIHQVVTSTNNGVDH